MSKQMKTQKQLINLIRKQLKNDEGISESYDTIYNYHFTVDGTEYEIDVFCNENGYIWKVETFTDDVLNESTTDYKECEGWAMALYSGDNPLLTR